MLIFANPALFLRFATRALPVAMALSGISLMIGLTWGLFFAPEDYLQGDSVRILYIHVPSASLAMGGYLGVAVCAAVSLIWKHPLADLAAHSLAPVGAVFAAICLLTGSIWGRPTWGTWWVWDARLTSMLILFFLFLGYIFLVNALERQARSTQVAAVLALIGVVNLPVITYSVQWWNTLHQGPSLRLFGKTTMDSAFVYPLLFSWAGFGFLFFSIFLMRMRAGLATKKIVAHSRRLVDKK